MLLRYWGLRCLRVKAVKVGGSVIAPKNRPLNADIPAILRLAEELSNYLRDSGNQLVLVHGGGSFGHYLVKECLTRDGELRRECFSRVAHYMMMLNSFVMEALLSSEVPAASLPPRSICFFRGKLPECFVDAVKELVSKGVTPVLFGDVIPSSTGFEVISGDMLVWELVKELGIKEVVFATDVNGIYTDDPKKNPKAKLLKEVRADEVLREAIEGEVTSSVTGGALEKVKVAVELGIKGVKASVINGLVPGNLYNALRGKVEGTVIWF